MQEVKTLSRGTRLSVLGLYNFDNHLFSNMHFPEGFTRDQKDTVITNILGECAELECLYPDYNTMSVMIAAWSAIELPVWNRIYKASLLDYNPIENYNRTEIETISDDRTEQHTGNDINRDSGTDTTKNISTAEQANSGQDTTATAISAYDSDALHTKENIATIHGHKINDSGVSDSTMTYGKTETFTHGEKIEHSGDTTRNNHTTGNIGVTTSQQMLEQEYNIAALLNVSKMIVESFKERFCLLVY